MNFRDFVLDRLPDDCSPEEALEKFQECQQQAQQRRDERDARVAVRAKQAAEQQAQQRRQKAEQTMAKVLNLSVFFDFYHPVSRLRAYDMRVRSTQVQAAVFSRDIAHGRFEGLALCATDAGGDGSARCPILGDGGAPHFVVDPDVNTVLVRGVLPTVSVWDVYDVAAQCPGFVAFSWTDPSSGDLRRDLRLSFASAEAAGRGLAELQAVADVGAAAALAKPASERLGLALPPEMSRLDRIVEDGKLAASIVRRLDSLMGVPAATSEAVLGVSGSPVQRLDLSILYLRRVHSFCFYGAAWCRDAWELRQRCGLVLLRDPVAEPPVEGEWAEKHDRRLREFLATAALLRPIVLTSDDEPVSSKCDDLVGALTLKVAEGRFKCAECQKMFKGPEYVRKHVRKVHGHLLEEIRQGAHVDAARDAFLAESTSSTGLLLDIALS